MRGFYKSEMNFFLLYMGQSARALRNITSNVTKYAYNENVCKTGRKRKM